MAATPAQMAANRKNALRSTGPKTVEGKEAAQRNALKHGLTGGGVVIPGEDEQEVAIRVAALEDQLVPAGNVLAALLVRQVAIASIRVERAFRHESALAAERMRLAGDQYEDERLTYAQRVLGEISVDPVTIRRRLLVAREGIDALIVRLRSLREKTDTTRHIAWDAEEGAELDHLLGKKPGLAPRSRVEVLTRGIAYDHWVGLDPAEFEGMEGETRSRWAVAQIQEIIDAEIANLATIRANLDTTPADRGHAEAAERTLLDLGKEGTALRRYAGAAERTMLKVLHELRLARAEAMDRSSEPTATATATATAATAAAATATAAEPVVVTETAARSAVPSESGSFFAAPRGWFPPANRGVIGPVEADPKSSFVPFAVGRGPDRPDPNRS